MYVRVHATKRAHRARSRRASRGPVRAGILPQKRRQERSLPPV